MRKSGRRTNFLPDADSIQEVILAQIDRIERKEEEDNSLDITRELQLVHSNFQRQVSDKCEEEILKIRMHQLALCKILVFTHGKSQFRLVVAHFKIGKAYSSCLCYSQAVDHLTVAIKKNAKVGQIRETKLYNSLIMTALSKCYFQMEAYEDSLDILNRAYQIQQAFVMNEKRVFNNQETITLIQQCYFKLKNYKSLLEFIDRSIEAERKLADMHVGDFSSKIIDKIVEKSKIHAEENNMQAAIEQIKIAIEYHQNTCPDSAKAIQAHECLVGYLQAYGDFEQQFKSLLKVEAYYDQVCKGPENQRILKLIEIKRKIALILSKELKYEEAIGKLNELHTMEVSVYGESHPIPKHTQTIMGVTHMNLGNTVQADHNFGQRHSLSSLKVVTD